MSINFAPGSVVSVLKMADGSTGWTFTLPAGVNNNSDFEISVV